MSLSLGFEDLPKALKSQLELHLSKSEYDKAVELLANNERIDLALDLCSKEGLLLNAATILERHGRIEEAREWYERHGNDARLAEFYTTHELYVEAAAIRMKQKLFEQAAQLYQKAGRFEESARIYESLNRYMNAIVCYQKAGLIDKQMQMQVAAFDYDYDLTEGDLAAIPMSLAMAVIAAKYYLTKPEKREKAYEILEKTQALRETAKGYWDEENYELAALLFLRQNSLPEAAKAFEKIGNYEKAADIYRALGDSQAEFRMLAKKNNYLKIGKSLILKRRLNDALTILGKIQKNSPDFAEASELQADILCKQKRFDSALQHYTVIENDSLTQEQSIKINYKAAYCFEAIGEYADALKYYLYVYEKDPNFRDIGERVAMLTAKQVKRARTLTGEADNEIKPLQDIGSRRRPSTYERQRVRTIGSGMFVSLDDIPTAESERYDIIEEVAHGGMGVVYRATDLILNRTVALKVLSQKLKDNDVARDYFIREARASAQLQHINIVTIFDIGKLTNGDVFLAMEFIDGKTLKQLVTQTGPFPTKFLTQLAIHACRGLQYAHDNGIIHRDVKSGNIMLAKKDKTLKILDLGLAKVLDENINEHTQAIGTPYYMSPEQVTGTEVDARSDIYSLGVTLFELATGTLPFLKGDLPYKHVHEAPPLPSSVNPSVNPKLEEIILACMNKKPADRYDSCNTLIEALKTVSY
ncbi:MAG: protein kinase [Bradymonadales bacterium]|jgi:tetratricopeptide (TPR) repeat protein